MQVLCSTGAFTRTSDPNSHEAILRYGPELDADGLEIIFYPRWYAQPERVVAALRASSLRFPVLHVEKSVGERFSSDLASERAQGLLRFEQNCAFAQQLGVQIVVLHLWGLPGSDAHLERNLEQLALCLDLAERHTLMLAIETIPCTHADPLTNVQRAIAHDRRACVALDTQFLAWHDQLGAVFDAKWMWQRAGIVRHAHLKDHAGPLGPLDAQTGSRYLHPGEGQIDFHRFVRRLRAVGYEGALSLEARAITPEHEVEVARIQTSLRFIRRLIADEGESAAPHAAP